MTDTVEVSDEAAIAAARVMAGAALYEDVGSAWVDCARRSLAAAVPLLRAQIAAEIEARRVPMPGDASQAGVIGWVMRDEALRDAARIARGDTP